MTYKTVTVGGDCPDHGEWEVYCVVPGHVTAQELMFAPEETDIICECYEKHYADMIVSLLNGEARH